MREDAGEILLRRNRVFRDRTNELKVFDDFDLYQKFRFRRENVFEIAEKVRDRLVILNRLRATELPIRVLLTLRFTDLYIYYWNAQPTWLI